jgi:hypothetical protein
VQRSATSRYRQPHFDGGCSGRLVAGAPQHEGFASGAQQLAFSLVEQHAAARPSVDSAPGARAAIPSWFSFVLVLVFVIGSPWAAVEMRSLQVETGRARDGYRERSARRTAHPPG